MLDRKVKEMDKFRLKVVEVGTFGFINQALSG